MLGIGEEVGERRLAGVKAESFRTARLPDNSLVGDHPLDTAKRGRIGHVRRLGQRRNRDEIAAQMAFDKMH